MKSSQVIESHKENSKKVINTSKDFVCQEQEDRQQSKVNDFFNNLSPSQKKIALQEIRFRKAKSNYADYIQLVNDGYKMTRYHSFLCKLCQSVVERIENNQKDLINSKKTFICISVPPQTGKTETITSTLPSYFVGRNPNLSAILVAYNGDYGEKFSDRNRQKTREYGKQIFGIELSETLDKKDEYGLKNHKGFVKGVGINAGITGNGCELLIVDDPYKNSNEANSSTYREAVSRVFKDSCLTRLHPGGACIVIHTRWHEEDLIAELSKDSDTIVINIPLVCDSENDVLRRQIGETLLPEFGYGANFAEETKKRVGLKIFNALYQGHPCIDGGDLIKREWLKFYDKSTLPTCFEELTMSCDLSFGGIKKENDPCAIQVWGRLGANHYLLKRIKKRMTFTETCEMIKIISAEYPLARKKIIEKKANGQAVIDSLNNVIGGFCPYDPGNTDKVGRVNAVSPLIQSGNVYFPSEKVDNTIEEMIDEMLKFPNGAHDDEVDAMTQYLITWEYKASGKFNTSNTIISFSKLIRGLYDD